MSIINMIAGPAIGAVIGYGTNYIAVKMLFRPLREVKVGGFTVPFTPGIIPKRKDQLAKALGNAVGSNLLTNKDLENLFLEETTKNIVLDDICKSIYGTGADSATIHSLMTQLMEEDSYQNGKNQLQLLISDKIIEGFSKLDIGSIIAKEGSQAIKEKTQGTMLAMMINDQLIESFATPIGDKVVEYVNENGKNMVLPIVEEELSSLENQTIGDMLQSYEIGEEQMRNIISDIYQKLVQSYGSKFIQQFDIVGIVEKKVNEMEVLEIEELVLSVMKNELNSVVKLGAIIGFLIGLLNLVFL